MLGSGGSSVEILLDGDLYNGKSTQPTFAPGQAVSGRVAYTPTARKTIDEVIIILSGRCYTVVRRPDVGGFGKDTYAEDIELFRMKRTLFTGPYTLQNTRTVWQFGFVLPKETNYVRVAGKDNWLYQSGPHELPPSVTSSGDGHRALLSYSLKVVVNPGSQLRSEDWTLPITITNCSYETLPPPESFSCPVMEVSHQRLKQAIAEKASLRQKIGHAFRRDSAHHQNMPFVATAYLPAAASISQALPISLSVRSLSQARVPDLTLVTGSLELIAKVHVRVNLRQTDYDEKIWEDIGHRILTEASIPLPTDGRVVELSKLMRLADLVPDQDRYRISPSFKSYTVNRSYYLKLHMSLRDSTSDSTFHVESRIPFLILPMEHPSINSIASESLLPQYSEAGPNLPAYIEHASET